MTDLVDRLRRYAGDVLLSTPTELEAADEIERLRTEIYQAKLEISEARLDERQAMAYLSAIQKIVGGESYPDMIELVRKLSNEFDALESQQPIYLFRRKGFDNFCTCDKEQYEELSQKHLFECKVAYAAPKLGETT